MHHSPSVSRTSLAFESSPNQLFSLASSETESFGGRPQERNNDVVTTVCELFQENPLFHLREIYSRISQVSHSFSSESTLFIICPHYSEVCFLSQQGATLSAFSLEFLFVSASKQLQWADYLSSLGGLTVIDGILSFDHHRRVRKYVCQDIAIMNGAPLLHSAAHTLSQRQELLGVWLFDSPFDEDILEGSIEFVLHQRIGWGGYLFLKVRLRK